MADFQNNLKLLTAKIEVTYGVDSAPVAASNAILARDFNFSKMEGTDAPRNFERPYLGAQQKYPTGLHGRISFKTDLVGHNVPGSAPGWGVLMRACGCAQGLSAGVSALYSPLSGGYESATLHFHHEGKRYRLRGARGSWRLSVNVDQIPEIEWTMTGLYDEPTDLALPASPGFGEFNTPQVVNPANTPTFTLNGVTLYFSTFTLNSGIAAGFRSLANRNEVWISDRQESVEVTVEAEALATLNPHALAAAQTPFAVNLVHGVGAGKVVTLAMPNCRLGRPRPSAELGGKVMWPLDITPLPTAGNDQFTLTLT